MAKLRYMHLSGLNENFLLVIKAMRRMRNFSIFLFVWDLILTVAIVVYLFFGGA